MIEVSGVSFAYGRRDVLSGVSLSCRKGEFTGILGPNGCGKTTLVRVMAGYLRPRNGEVRYEGTSLDSLSPAQAALLRAVVEQQISSPFEFTVTEYVMLGRHPHLKRFQSDTARDRAIVQGALAQTGTIPLKDRVVGGLSGGELQRVMIARALAQEPSYLLLDEPTAHLDISHQLEIMEVLQGLARRIAVIAVIHDLNLAANFCDRVAVLSEGTVVGWGPPEEVLEAPRIREIFGVQSVFLESPAHERAQLAFTRMDEPDPEPLRIHLFGGGGCGQRALFALARAGYTVTAGVLNEGDRDREVALSLGCEVVTAPPFSRIAPEERERVHRLCQSADAVVVAAMPVGEGNRANLEEAVSWLGRKPVVLYQARDTPRALDYTGGKGALLYNELQARARSVRTLGELKAAMAELAGGTGPKNPADAPDARTPKDT